MKSDEMGGYDPNNYDVSNFLNFHDSDDEDESMTPTPTQHNRLEESIKGMETPLSPPASSLTRMLLIRMNRMKMIFTLIQTITYGRSEGRVRFQHHWTVRSIRSGYYPTSHVGQI